MYRVEVGETVLEEDSIAISESAKVVIANLYEQHYNRIVRYIYAHVNDQSEAENLGGDVFLKAMQSLKSYRGSHEQILTWLFKIAHNLVVDYMRKRSRQKNISLGNLDVPDTLNVEELVETTIEFENLSEALKQLTPAQREVIGLRFFAGLSSSEVSRIMGKKNGAVREMQCSAIKALRKLMYDTCEARVASVLTRS
jgi:RNA polymerase sigma-70 factor (ECF subfamily)